jgi:hypothetical protein
MPGVPHRLFDTVYIEKIKYLSHISIATQTLSEFLLDRYVLSIDGVSLKSDGGTWGGSLVSRSSSTFFSKYFGEIGVRVFSFSSRWNFNQIWRPLENSYYGKNTVY